MTVFVDDMRTPYGRLILCHMIADSIDELHAMADKIGVARKWFQDTISGPHYDIALSKRALAISFGAREITLRQCAAMSHYRARTGRMLLRAPEDAERLMAELRASARASA